MFMKMMASLFFFSALLTYHQLKRLNIITSFMEERQIVIGYSDISDVGHMTLT